MTGRFQPPAARSSLSPANAAESDATFSLRRPLTAALITILVAFGGFLSWGWLARLDAAALAPGVVIADSHRKTVQHLEGGIIAELLVRDGSRVHEGDVLVRLDPTFARSEAGQLEARQWLMRARLLRLEAEAAGRREAALFDPLLAEAPDAEARQSIESERALFLSRWRDFDSKTELLEQRTHQLDQEIAALEAQIGSAEAQLRYTREELAAVKTLYAKGYERRPRLLELERNVSDLEGRRGESLARQAKAQQEIAGTRLEIRHEHEARRSEIAAALVDTRAELAEIEERLHSARNVLQRVEVRAPQDGLVTNMQVFGPGAVLKPGDPILDIVPLHDALVIEIMIDPHDIDAVYVGAPVHVRLTAYKQKKVPTIAGELSYVAADRQLDQRTGNAYYPGRVTLRHEALARINRVELYPGMPAEAMIVLGERRALDYFLTPITTGLTHAFREE